jgi:hypothetical protein
MFEGLLITTPLILVIAYQPVVHSKLRLMTNIHDYYLPDSLAVPVDL